MSDAPNIAPHNPAGDSPAGFVISPDIQPELKKVFEALNLHLADLGISAESFDHEVQRYIAMQNEYNKLYTLHSLLRARSTHTMLTAIKEDLPGRWDPRIVPIVNKDIIASHETIAAFVDALHEQLNAGLNVQAPTSRLWEMLTSDPTNLDYHTTLDVADDQHLLARLATGELVLHPKDETRTLSLVREPSITVGELPLLVFTENPANRLGFSIANAIHNAIEASDRSDKEKLRLHSSSSAINFWYDKAINHHVDELKAAYLERHKPSRSSEAAALEEMAEHRRLTRQHHNDWNVWLKEYTENDTSHPYPKMLAQYDMIANARPPIPLHRQRVNIDVCQMPEVLRQADVAFRAYLETKKEKPAESIATYQLNETTQRTASRIARKGSENIAATLKAGTGRNVQALYEYLWTRELEPLRAVLNKKDPAEAELGDAIFADEIMAQAEYYTGFERAKSLSATPAAAIERLGGAIQTAFAAETLAAMEPKQLAARLHVWDRLTKAPCILIALSGLQLHPKPRVAADATYYDAARRSYQSYATNVDPEKVASNKELFANEVEPALQAAIAQLGLEHVGPYCHAYGVREIKLSESLRTPKPKSRGISHLKAVQDDIATAKKRAFTLE